MEAAENETSVKGRTDPRIPKAGYSSWRPLHDDWRKGGVEKDVKGGVGTGVDVQHWLIQQELA